MSHHHHHNDAKDLDPHAARLAAQRSSIDYTDFPAFPTKVVVHPLVLLSVVDHYNRVAKDTNNRVAGVLLGEISKDGVVDCTNSFAVPFEEDPKDPSIWFFDHSFLENMLGMFRKVTGRCIVLDDGK